MDNFELTPLSEIIEEVFGPVGTPERDAMEEQLKCDLEASRIGNIIREARQSQNLTQEELGEKVGVKRAQISRLEKGTSVITLPTIRRIFKALGVPVTMDIGFGAGLKMSLA